MQKNNKRELAIFILMAAVFAAPLAHQTLRGGIFFLYESAANGSIIKMVDAAAMLQSGANIISECAWVAGAALYVLLVRALFGIATPARKAAVALGAVFYLLPFQITLVVIVAAILQNAAAISWNLQSAWAAAMYAAALGMSLWIYRILVSRKNSTFKAALAAACNALVVLAAFSPSAIPGEAGFATGLALAAAWAAAAADITFEGLGYSLISRAYRAK